jgi:Na+-translocating ferredoxin:NAD+ oxidoreductase RnfE subunit
VAYAQAAGVPMAAPDSCCQNMLEKLKTLLFMMISSTSRNNSFGNLVGMCPALAYKNCRIANMSEAVSMLVYMETVY